MLIEYNVVGTLDMISCGLSGHHCVVAHLAVVDHRGEVGIEPADVRQQLRQRARNDDIPRDRGAEDRRADPDVVRLGPVPRNSRLSRSSAD